MKDKTRLEFLRNEKNYSMRFLASHLGISESVYSRWENNKIDIPTKWIYRIANFYKVNIDYILNLTDTRIFIESNNNIDIELSSNRIKIIRQEFNESLSIFAERFNTTKSTWSAYENGKTIILDSFLIELSKISNSSIDWILGRNKNRYLH